MVLGGCRSFLLLVLTKRKDIYSFAFRFKFLSLGLGAFRTCGNVVVNKDLM